MTDKQAKYEVCEVCGGEVIDGTCVRTCADPTATRKALNVCAR